MFEQPEIYAKIVAGSSGDPYSSPIRSFFEALKTVDVRSFTTGITPIALADASGANMIKDQTHSPRFGEMCGFLRKDVEAGVQGVLGKNHEAVGRVVALMETYYDGYRFKGTKAGDLTDALYNTQLCLYFLWRLKEREFFRKVVNEWSVNPATADTKKLLDRGAARHAGTSRCFFRVARQTLLIEIRADRY